MDRLKKAGAALWAGAGRAGGALWGGVGKAAGTSADMLGAAAWAFSPSHRHPLLGGWSRSGMAFTDVLAGTWTKPVDPWAQGRIGWLSGQHGPQPPPLPPRSRASQLGMGGRPDKFFGRGALGHLAKGAKNVRLVSGALTMGLLGGGIMGTVGGTILHGAALSESDPNLLHPYNGMPRQIARGVGGFVGFDIGGAIGAGLGTIAAPIAGPLAPLAPVIGFALGGLAGAQLGMGAGDIPFRVAEMGAGMKTPFRSQFVDSEQAVTMRQRAVEMINRSHMNARSALGQEAAAYHI